MATVKKKKKSNFVDQVVNGEYQSIFNKNNTGASSNKNVTNASTPSNKTSSTIITGSATGSLLGDDSPFLSTQKKSSFVDQVIGGTFESSINTTSNSTNKKESETEKSSKISDKKDYSSLSEDELKKETEKLQKEIEKQSKKLNKTPWWNKDDNVVENIGNVLYKSFLERDPVVHDEEYEKYKSLTKQMEELKNIKEDNYVKNQKYDKGLMGFIEKSNDTMVGNVMTGVKGIESTTKKILGQEDDIDYDLTLQEKLSSKAREESDGAMGVYLDVTGSVARMTPQLALGNPTGALALGFANYGGGAYNEAKRQGATEEQATKYGVVIGGLEMGMEKLLGGFESVYGKSAMGKVTDKIMGKVLSNQALRKAVSGMGAEFTEEYVQEFLEPIVKNVVLEEKNGADFWNSENLEEGVKRLSSQLFNKENLYAGLLGGLTSGVVGAQSNIDAYRYNKRTGRNIDTGLTANEQSVIDSVSSEKKAELQKKKAVDTEVNKIIKEQEKTFGTLTNAEKKGIRQDVQSRLDNGEIDYSTAKLSSKEIKTIESQVKDDLQKGYIGTDVIENTLGKDVDLSKDDYLQKSYYEKSLKSKQFTYKAGDSDSEFRKELAKTSDVLNDTTRSHELFDTVAKISEDTGTKYGFVNNEKLKSLGHNVEGKTINGLVRVNEDGTSKVLINVDSDKALNTIIGHETTHLLEGTNEYQALQDIVKEYAKNKGDYDSKYNQISSLYQGTNANVENEVTSDLVGDYLFTDQDFISNLSSKQPSVFQKVYDYIKHVYNLATAGSKEQRELEKVKYKFEQAYNQTSKTTTQQSETNLTTEADSNTTKYHISSTFSEEIDKTLNDEMKRGSQVKARDYTPEILVNNGVKDLPMLITQKHVKSIVYTTEEANRLGLSSESNYHGLGKDLLVKSIDNMDNPLEIYKKSDNQYIIVTELTDSEGHKIIVPVKIDGKGSYNDVYIDENHIQSVYGKRNLESYLERNSFEQIYNKKGTTLNEGSRSSDISSSMDINIPYKATTVNEEAHAWYNEQLELLKGDTEGLEVLQEFFDNGKNVTPDTVEEFITDYYSTDDVKEWNDRVKELSGTKYSLSDIQGLENYSKDDIKNITNDYIKQKLEENDLYDVEVKGIEIHGSRARGTAKVNSDLDVVVEYAGDVREDTLFNILNDVENQLEIEGIKVDINPITENDTGTLKDYMKRSNEYDKEVLAKQNTKYSLSEKGTLVDDKGNDVTLEVSDTGNTNTLMAIHNLNADKLKGVLELGGFPVPSIAVVDSAKVTHSQFGNISVLFDKETINPANRLNEVYDRDVWSPTFPSVEVEIDNAKLKNISKESGISDLHKDSIVNDAILRYFYEENLSDSVDRFGFEGTLDKIKNDNSMKYAYLKAKDNSFEPVTKPREFGNYSNDIYQEFLNSHGKLSDPFSMSYDEIMQYGKDVQTALKVDLDNKMSEISKYEDSPDKMAFWTRLYTDEYNKIPENYREIDEFLRSAYNLQTYGSNATEIDQEATLKKASDTINQQEYEKWVDDNFNGIIKKKGIRNDKDLFTPSGNRRSFSQLHDDYTLRSIVNYLTKQKTVAGQEGFSAGSGFGTIQAQMSKRFNSIDEIKQYAKNRLTTSTESAEVLNALREVISDDMTKLGEYFKFGSGYYSESYDNSGYALNDFAGYKTQNISNLKKALENNNIDSNKVPIELLQKIVDDVNRLKDIPTDYFEAKPQRAVGLDEIQAVVIPNDTDTDLKQQLSDRGLYVVEYDSNIEGDRQNKINQFDDLKFSLSNQNENIAPVGNYNVYGKDVRLQQQVQEAIAPLQEQVKVLSDQLTTLTENIAPVSQDVVERENTNNFNALTDEDAPTNLSDEEIRELDRLNSLPFDLEGEEQSRVDELTSKQDEYGSFNMDNETPDIKNKSTIIKDLKGFGMSQQEARNLYNKIANDSKTTPEDIFNELKNYRDIYEESEYYKEIRNDIKGTRLNISNIKNQITDYGNSYRMSLMGKRLILGNSGQSIDTFYQELSNSYPDVFSPEITAEVDQLDAIADFLYRDDKMLVDRLSDGEITELANKIYNEIDTTERLNNTRETLYSNSNFKNLVSMLEKGEITPEIYEDFLKSLPKDLSAKFEPYLEVARGLNASSTDKTRQKDRIRSLLDEKSIKGQENTNEPTISSNNPFDELLDKFLKKKRTKPDVAPKVEKNKVRSLVDTTKELFVNRNTEIDNLAKESGNLNIKYAGDMLNSVAGEAEGDIYTAQTDNYGHEIGKSVSGLFQEAKNKGLYDAFNDYLEQYSNIDRHSQGKGSQTPLAVSQKLVQDYEKSYPGFKKMAQDVWKYSSNIRDNMVESGLITQEFSDTLAEMYPHYVPFMENKEMTNVYQDIGEAKPKGVIKYAKGGAKNLLPIEEALTKYTYASKKAVRQNQLYQQIVKTLNDKVEIGADVRSDPTELSESLYRDEKGNYLTAYVNGKQESVRISDDLYRGLKNDMESRVKDLEQRLSLVTKPLQKVSEVRRNLLTTWSPTFIITNPVKDIQDAVFNSKYTKDMLKNYPTSFVELSRAKSETAKQFLALYGSGNTQGDYSIDSGLNKGIAKKNTKFLKGISKLNNIVELAPRYAEFKASLENGATVQEAMYNAREITTNFNRGGTITKALNRNGATFLNASVQGFDKFVRNFSGENGAKGVASALLKAGLFGVLPGVFNELAFGGDDDDKDEDYEALPDYIKDNYYLIKTGDGDFIRIPKGRMLSVFGSASRRTIEYLNGEEDAFEGFLKNAYTQVGFNDPKESNIFTPIKQAIDNEAWYGGDLVPSRLQKLAPKEQYDASTDKFSIWLGDKLNISPYKINYVLDQYTGGIGDMVLPLITEEAQSDSDSIPEMMLAPIRDKFTANSTSDNKYASDIYTLSDKMDKATSDIKETDEYKIQDSYLYDITSQMAELYQERRDVQADTSLSKSEKYNKVQSIQEQINSLAKEGLDNYKNVQKTDNYAIVGGREFNKYTTDDGEERWGKPREDELNDLNSMGMTLYEKSSYFKAKTDISSIKDEYKDSEDYVSQKRDIIDAIKNTYLNDEQKSYLYDRYYGNTETLGIVNAIGIDFDSYLDYEYQSFTADKDSNGKSISGSKKQKVFDYINSMDIDFEQKLILAKLQYNSYDEYNYDIVDYLNTNDDISYEDEVSILKKLGFTVDDEGNIYW